MAKTKISEFSATPANNTDIDGINIAEGCAPSGINDAIRELMAQLKDWQSGTSNDPYVIGSSGSLTLNQGTANGVPYLNGSKVVTSGSALTFDGTNLATTGSVTSAGASNSGNLAFTGTGNRITGDFSNATVANRAMFQTSTVNTASDVGIIPNGTASTASVSTFNSSAPDNSAFLGLSITSSEARLRSSILGTGTYLPMTFQTGGSERMRLDTSGNVGIGTSSPATKLNLLTASATAVALRAGNSVSYAEFQVDASGNSQLIAPGGAQIFNTNGAERMRIDSSGNVGIGTSSPSTAINTVGSTTYSGTANGTALFQAVKTNTAADAGVLLGSINGNTPYIASTNLNNGGGAATALAFYTGGSERARIDTSGNLLVNATSAVSGEKLFVTTNAAQNIIGARLGASGSNATCFLAGNATGATSFDYFGAYNGSGTKMAGITSAGTFQSATNTYGGTSDERLKENITDATPKLNDLLSVRIRNFNFKSDEQKLKQIGVIAQELETVFPALVEDTPTWNEQGESTGTVKNVKYSVFVPMLIKAMQEQQAIITALTARVAALESN